MPDLTSLPLLRRFSLRPFFVVAGAFVWRARLPLLIFTVEFFVAVAEWLEARHHARTA